MSIDPPEFEQKPETTNSLGDKWSYDTFRHYLVGLTKGRDFVLPQEQFPKEIELSAGWHGVFNKMRSETDEDGKERWAGIGYKTNGATKELFIYLNFQ